MADLEGILSIADVKSRINALQKFTDDYVASASSSALTALVSRLLAEDAQVSAQVKLHIRNRHS